MEEGEDVAPTPGWHFTDVEHNRTVAMWKESIIEKIDRKATLPGVPVQTRLQPELFAYLTCTLKTYIHPPILKDRQTNIHILIRHTYYWLSTTAKVSEKDTKLQQKSP